jgi:hypothetical protein
VKGDEIPEADLGAGTMISGLQNESPHGKREAKVRRGIKPDFANNRLRGA